MNKYQREKSKRIKKLSNLGISYSCQKHLMRNYNLEQIDNLIEKTGMIKRSGILEKTIKSLAKAGQALISALKFIKKDSDILEHPERINFRRK